MFKPTILSDKPFTKNGPTDKAFKAESLQNKITENEVAKCLNASKYALDAVGKTPVFIKINPPNKAQ